MHSTRSGFLLAVLLLLSSVAFFTPEVSAIDVGDPVAVRLHLLNQTDVRVLGVTTDDSIATTQSMNNLGGVQAQSVGQWEIQLDADLTLSQDFTFNVEYSVPAQGAAVVADFTGTLKHDGNTIATAQQQGATGQPGSSGVFQGTSTVSESFNEGDFLQVEFTIQMATAGSIDILYGSEATHHSYIQITADYMQVEIETVDSNERLEVHVAMTCAFGWQCIDADSSSISHSSLVIQGADPEEVRLASFPVPQPGGTREAVWIWNFSSTPSPGLYNIQLDFKDLSDNSQDWDEDVTRDLDFEGPGTIGDFPPLIDDSNELLLESETKIEKNEVVREIVLTLEGTAAAYVRWGMDHMGSPYPFWADQTARNPAPNQKVDDNEKRELANVLKGEDDAQQFFALIGISVEALFGVQAMSEVKFPTYDIQTSKGSGISQNPVIFEISGRWEAPDGLELIVVSQVSTTPEDRRFVSYYESTIYDVTLVTTPLVSLVDKEYDRDVGESFWHLRQGIRERLTFRATEPGTIDFEVSASVSRSVLNGPLIILLFVLFFGGVVGVFGPFAWKLRSKRPLNWGLLAFSGGAVLLELILYIFTWAPGFVIVILTVALCGGTLFAGNGAYKRPKVLTFRENPAAAGLRVKIQTTSAMDLGDPGGSPAAGIVGGGEVVPTVSRTKARAPGRARAATSVTNGQKKAPTVTCPVCHTKNPVTSDERPISFPCSNCETTLRLKAKN